jgi:hypothetical protein
MATPYIFTGILLLYVLTIFISFFIFDQLVMAEYFDHRHQWELDGKPNGFFWVPRDATVLGGLVVRFGSSLAGRHNWRVWLWSTPAWMKRDPRVLRLLHWWRGLFIGSQVGIVLAVLILVLS